MTYYVMLWVRVETAFLYNFKSCHVVMYCYLVSLVVQNILISVGTSAW